MLVNSINGVIIMVLVFEFPLQQYLQLKRMPEIIDLETTTHQAHL
jgi:hypothetical protein